MIKIIPDVKFQTRVRDDSLGGDNPFKWEEKTSSDYFTNKKVIQVGNKAMNTYKREALRSIGKTADNSNLIKLIGKYNFTSIENGIKSSVDWFINNYETCRK